MLIGLLGLKGSGKDTAAGILAGQGFLRMAFADELYAEVAAGFSVTPHFLARRDTKETPLGRLSLKFCRDPQFVAIATTERVRGGLTVEAALNAPRSPRWVLQQWGTEYRRRPPFGHDGYWVGPLMRRIDAKPKGARIALTDVREPIEVENIRARGGALVRIRRSSVEREDVEAVTAGLVSALHSSEILARTCAVDLEVENVEGDPQSMRSALVALMARLKEAA